MTTKQQSSGVARSRGRSWAAAGPRGALLGHHHRGDLLGAPGREQLHVRAEPRLVELLVEGGGELARDRAMLDGACPCTSDRRRRDPPRARCRGSPGCTPRIPCRARRGAPTPPLGHNTAGRRRRTRRPCSRRTSSRPGSAAGDGEEALPADDRDRLMRAARERPVLRALVLVSLVGLGFAMIAALSTLR